jgi:uncharacterized repeat protein (TIGR01451 family)
MLLVLMLAGLNQAQAGPVIIDGTDANEHGSSPNNKNKNGWLYMQKVLEALAEQLPPQAEHVLVVMGTVKTSEAREAIDNAFYNSSLALDDFDWRIVYKETAQAIDQWLAQISISNTGILYIPTFGEINGDLNPVEMARINKRRVEIAKYIKQAGVRDGGGALFAMAESGKDADGNNPYKWLQSLVAGIKVIDLGEPGNDTSINLTECGMAGLPGLPKEELAVSIPWHNYFEGNFGALAVFATARDKFDVERNVILGGAIADLLISVSATPDSVPPGSPITYSIQVTNDGPCPAPFVTVTNDLPVSTILLSCSASDGGECSATGNSLKVIFPSLLSHTTATVTVMAAVGCPPDGNPSIINTAMVESAAFDPKLQSNTKTLTATVTGVSEAKINPQVIELGPVEARAKFKNKPTSPIPLIIENTGDCFSLTAKFFSIRRAEAEIKKGKLGNPDDRALFPLSVNNTDGVEIPIIVGDPSSQFTIAPKQSQILQVRFQPVIPAFRKQSGGLPSTLVLPCTFKSLLALSANGDTAIEITSKINKKVTLINPDNPKRAPVVTLTRSGNDFTIGFTVYDCDPLDVQNAKYDFLDGGGSVVHAFTVASDEMRQAIQSELDADRLQEGQSFRAIKTHHIAKNSSKITRVRVTVNAGSSSDVATSGAVNSSSSINANLSIGTQNSTVLLPTVNLPPSAGNGVTRNSRKRIKASQSESKQGIKRNKND